MRTGVYRLPLDRAARLELSARDLLWLATAHQRWVRFAPLRVFCGTAVSTTLSVVPALFHLRSLINVLSHRHPRSGDCRVCHRALADLHWWAAISSTGYTLARPIGPTGPTIQLETDASRLGWGAVLNRSTTAREPHPPDRAAPHISLLEMGAVRLALQSFWRFLPPARAVIGLNCDSMGVLGVLHAQSSPSLARKNEYSLLIAVLKELRVEMRHECVASALNACADRLSCTVELTD